MPWNFSHLLCLLYHQHQEVSKTELLCACYCVWLFLSPSISFLLLCLLYHRHQDVSKTELLCACNGVWLFLFSLLCLLYQQLQKVSKTELLCACYGVCLFLFYFSVYSIINIRRWIKLNYCVHVTVFDYFFSPSLSTLSSTSGCE